MGPGTPPPEGGPQVAIISSAELHATWSADYFVNRLPGETWTAFRVRREIEDLERRAQAHDEAAAKLRAKIETLRGD
jgi:hypothetical protein